jgi:hypothetical protein
MSLTAKLVRKVPATEKTAAASPSAAAAVPSIKHHVVELPVDTLYKPLLVTLGGHVATCLASIQSHIDANKALYNYAIAGKSIDTQLGIELLKLPVYRDTIKLAKDKNEYPDYNYNNGELAIDSKAFVIEKDGRRLTSCNNDMSPLNSWTNSAKKRAFKAHIQIWTGYRVNADDSITITDFWVGHIWDFVGVKDGTILSYREKDGNLRPRPFKEWGKPAFKSYAEFFEAVRCTNVYRSARIIDKHVDDSLTNLVTDSDRIKMIEDLIASLTGKVGELKATTVVKSP